MSALHKIVPVFISLVFVIALGVPSAYAVNNGNATNADSATEDTPSSSPGSNADAYVAPDEEEYQKSVASGQKEAYESGEISTIQGPGIAIFASRVPWVLVIAFTLIAVFAVVCIVYSLRVRKRTKRAQRTSRKSGSHSRR